jgi:DNA replication and repair protein RecF
VRVLSVQLRDFRSYARAEANLGEGLTVVHGPNGAGKSNLLEAIFYGCTARSPRTRNERELIHFGAQAARVALRFSDGAREHELTVAYGSSGGRADKRMTSDGATVEHLLDLAQRPLVGVFAPDRLELIKGPPALRRAHLDQLVAALWPARAADRQAYGRVLAQRNALIARMRAGRATPQTLRTWNRELAATGLRLREHRELAVGLLADPFNERASNLGCSGDVRLRYRPGASAQDEDEFVSELESRLQSDLDRGYSGYGPHRDELAIVRDERELRSFGSQGEQRLALLALLLAERGVLARERDQIPLMLLDDVMSELDGQRREQLAEELRAGGQSVIATTDLSHVPGGSDARTARLRVSPGTILQEALAA